MKKVVVRIILVIIAVAILVALNKIYYKQVCKDSQPKENILRE